MEDRIFQHLVQHVCVDAASGSTHRTLLISRTGVISFVESFHTSAIDATPILDAPSLFFRRASAASLLVDKDYEARVAFLALRTLGIVITEDCERSVLARLRAVAKVREATAIHPAPLAPPTHEDNDQQDEILGAVVPSSSSQSSSRPWQRMSRKRREQALIESTTLSSATSSAPGETLAAAASARIQQLEEQLKQAHRRETYWKQVAAARKEELTTITKAQTPYTGKAERYLTVAAGMRMACQRNCSHVSCSGLIEAHGLDLGGGTVAQWEIKAAAAVLSASHHFYEGLRRHRSDGNFFVKVTAVAGDGTHSRAFRRSEVQGLKVETLSINLTKAELDQIADGMGEEQFLRRTVVESDVHRILEHKGDDVHRLMRKQMNIVGAPDWTTPTPDGEISMFVIRSDRGSNMVAARKDARRIAIQNNCFIFEADCWCHQLHLSAKLLYSLVDSTLKACDLKMHAYWPSLVKLFRVWRDTDTPRVFYNTWLERHGALAAETYAQRIPPIPLTGRWLSSDACEEFVIAPPHNELKDVVTHVLATQAARNKRKTSSSSTPIPITDGGAEVEVTSSTTTSVSDMVAAIDETTQDYRERMSKYAIVARDFVAHDVFPLLIRIVFQVKSPFRHAMKYLQPSQYTKATDAHAAPMSKFVCGGAKKIMDEFENLMRPGTWHSTWALLPETAVERSTTLSALHGLLVVLAVSGAEDFSYRIFRHCESLPALLLWLISGDVEKTKAVATQLLNASSSELDHNCSLFLQLFPDDIRAAALDGELGIRATLFLRILRRVWFPSTAEQESLNSVITTITERSPNLSNALLAARITLKKMITSHADTYLTDQIKSSGKKRISKTHQREARLKAIQEVTAICVDNWDAKALEIYRDPKRYELGDFGKLIPIAAVPGSSASSKPDARSRWVTAIHAKLFKIIGRGSCRISFGMCAANSLDNRLEDGPWLAFYSYGPILRMVKCAATYDAAGYPTTLRICIPYIFTESPKWLRQEYDRLNVGLAQRRLVDMRITWASDVEGRLGEANIEPGTVATVSQLRVEVPSGVDDSAVAHLADAEREVDGMAAPADGPSLEEELARLLEESGIDAAGAAEEAKALVCVAGEDDGEAHETDEEIADDDIAVEGASIIRKLAQKCPKEIRECFDVFDLVAKSPMRVAPMQRTMALVLVRSGSTYDKAGYFHFVWDAGKGSGSVGRLSGRDVNVDPKDHTIICSTHLTNTRRNIDDADVLLASTGIMMKKESNHKFRDAETAALQRFKSMCNAAVASATDRTMLDVCAFCIGLADATAMVLPTKPGFTCSFCSLEWHTDCHARITAEGTTNPFIAFPRSRKDELVAGVRRISNLELFTDGKMCAWCSACIFKWTH